jgi:lysine-specific demethylase/histidyl-hydroxylase NO66
MAGNQRRTVHPSGGRATATQINQYTSDGCSVRFLCPQRFSSAMWSMINQMEDYMGFQSGANTYWTPAGTQGFAPHFDDVDIFVLQTEGAKRWRLHPARDESEILPRFSSRNFEQAELAQPYANIVLRKGDFLYAPRGTTHQCTAMPTMPSMHITLSSCQRVSWLDYLHVMLPRALDLLAEEHIELRKTLPRNFHQFLGVMHQDRDDERRDDFQSQFLGIMTALVESQNLPFDATADQLAKQFMHGRVPPSAPSRMQAQTAAVHAHSFVRLVQAGVARLVDEQGEEPPQDEKGGNAPAKISLYHTLNNSRKFQEAELACLRYPITSVAPRSDTC